MMFELRDLYEEMILEHNRNPRNFSKKPEGANHSGYGFNPLCGDEFHVHLAISDGVVADVGFDGAGCAISTASASIMTEALIGKSVSEVQALFERTHEMFVGDAEADVDDIGKVAVLAGVRDYPTRIKCATLAWHVMKAALEGSGETVCTE
jgi:nitrogen fixation NifU-like protein